MRSSQNLIYKTTNDPVKKQTIDLNKQFSKEYVKFTNKTHQC